MSSTGAAADRTSGRSGVPGLRGRPPNSRLGWCCPQTAPRRGSLSWAWIARPGHEERLWLSRRLVPGCCGGARLWGRADAGGAGRGGGAEPADGQRPGAGHATDRPQGHGPAAGRRAAAGRLGPRRVRGGRAGPSGPAGPAAGGVPAATPALPRDIACFTGRQARASRAGRRGGGAGGVVSIHAIGGMAGIGKTALAVHAAHQLAAPVPGRADLLAAVRAHPGAPPGGPGRCAGQPAADGRGPAGRSRPSWRRGWAVARPAGRTAAAAGAGRRGRQRAGPPLLPGAGGAWCWSPAAGACPRWTTPRDSLDTLRPAMRPPCGPAGRPPRADPGRSG